MANDEMNPDDSKERSDFEKEVQKLKELAENGDEMTQDLRRLMDSDNPLERAFADHIIRFERAAKDPDTRTLRAILGHPSFPEEASLSDGEVEAELERAHAVLAKKNILMDCIYPTPAREVYRFITEELLENDDGFISVPGMTHHFIYEEFYPNHPEDIKKTAHEVIEAICDKEFNEYTCFLRNGIKLRGVEYSSQEFPERINDHLEIFGPLALLNLEIGEVLMDEPHAAVDATFTVIHHFDDGQTTEIKAKGKFEFYMEYDNYNLSSVSIPELGM